MFRIPSFVLLMSTAMTVFSSSDPLNGELVCDGKEVRGCHPDADRMPVTLRRGKNRIMVFSDWLFHISLGEIGSILFR